jgi:3-oxoacyl-[acyl-carrier-protein] synthase II
MRRAVITGVGLVTPLGASTSMTWGRLVNSDSGIDRVTQFDVQDLPSKIAGTIPEGATSDGLFSADDWVEPKEQRKIDRFILLGMVAAAQAVADSGWVANTPEAQNRTGVIIGSGIGGLQQIHDNSLKLKEAGPRRISPFFIPAALI